MDKKLKWFEVEFSDGYSIIIKGIRKPNKRQAAKFLKSDMEKLKLSKVVGVTEWEYDDVRYAFDLEKEGSFPVFGVKK